MSTHDLYVDSTSRSPRLFARPLLVALVAVLAAALVLTACELVGPGAEGVTVVDALGREVNVPEPPQRIVSVFLGADNILLALVDLDRLHAVTALIDDPDYSFHVGREDLAELERAQLATTERLLQLNGDLVFVSLFTQSDVVEQVIEAGLTVIVVPYPVTFDDIRANIRLIAQAVHEQEAGEALVTELDARLASLNTAVAAVEREAPPSVLYYSHFGFSTTVAGTETTAHTVIEAAGAVNAAGAMGLEGFPEVSEEQILQMDPEYILLNENDATGYQTLHEDEALSQLTAVQEGRVLTLPARHLGAVSQFMVETVEELAELLYPELVEENGSASRAASMEPAA